MSDTPASPAPLSDDYLRETLDLLATAVASISDRVDDQTRVLDRVNKTATEARSAAFAAQKQTDPEHDGKVVDAAIDGRIGDTLTRVGQMAGDLLRASNHTQEILRKADEAKSDTMRQLWEQKLDRFESRLPWFGLGAVVLVLVLTVTPSRFLARNASMCAVLGASWTTTTTGVDACVYYQW